MGTGFNVFTPVFQVHVILHRHVRLSFPALPGSPPACCPRTPEGLSVSFSPSSFQALSLWDGFWPPALCVAIACEIRLISTRTFAVIFSEYWRHPFPSLLAFRSMLCSSPQGHRFRLLQLEVGVQDYVQGINPRAGQRERPGPGRSWLPHGCPTASRCHSAGPRGSLGLLGLDRAFPRAEPPDLRGTQGPHTPKEKKKRMVLI